MSSDLPQQSTPIVVKTGNKQLFIPIRINAYSEFQITEGIQTGSDDWTQSQSDFSISYVESINIGEPGGSQQFCQTSTMSHPLTFTFKDSDDNDIFTITEIASGSVFGLHIGVQFAGGFFHVEQATGKGGEDWSESVFDPSDTEISTVEVKDSNDVPVCQFVITSGESDIFLDLEPV